MRVYGHLLTQPGIAFIVASTIVSRLAVGINGLALLIFMQAETGSFSEAGLATGAMALGTAAGGPVMATVVDRRNERPLVPLAIAHSVGLLALLSLGRAGAPILVLTLIALAAGAMLPPTTSVLRSRWRQLVRGESSLLSAAFALDSVLIELVFVVGPLLTAMAVATTGPGGALVLSAVCTAVGTTTFVAALDRRSDPRRQGGGRLRLDALRSAGLRILVVASVPLGFYLGSIEVALPAFSDALGSPAFAGMLLAAFSCASAAGGLAYGTMTSRHSLPRIHIAFSALLPLACIPLALASSLPVAIALAALAGAPVAPVIATRNQLVGTVARPGTGTESFTWPLTAMIAGISLGVAVGGRLVEAYDWWMPLLAASAVSAGAVALIAWRRGALVEPSAPERGKDAMWA